MGSRHSLNEDSVRGRLRISLAAILLGIIGLVTFSIKYKDMIIMPLIFLIPWFTSSLMISTPRMTEPILPLLYFGAIFLLTVVMTKLFSYSSGNDQRTGDLTEERN